MATAIFPAAKIFTTAAKEFSQRWACPFLQRKTRRRDLLAKGFVMPSTVRPGDKTTRSCRCRRDPPLALGGGCPIPTSSRTAQGRRSCTVEPSPSASSPFLSCECEQLSSNLGGDVVARQMSALPDALPFSGLWPAALDTSIDVFLSFCCEARRQSRRFVGLGPEWAGRPKYLPLSLSARLHGSLSLAHLLSYDCGRLQNGDAFRWLVKRCLPDHLHGSLSARLHAFTIIVGAPVALSP
jgi:hypothetical protein